MVKPEGAAKVVRRAKVEKAIKKKMGTVAAVFSQAPCLRSPAEVIDSLFTPADARPERARRPTGTEQQAGLDQPHRHQG